MSNAPANPETDALWSPEGPFAKRFPGYEAREEQQRMFHAALQALESEQCLTVEAGTGTGKSLAYLAAIMIHSKRNPRMKAAISTNTISLQHQLADRDIPAAVSALTQDGHLAPGQFSHVILKGKSNYLCRQNLEQLQELAGNGGRSEAASLAGKIRRWDTATGDRAELDLTGGELAAWNAAAAAQNENHCALYQSRSQNPPCHLAAARRRAQEASLIVINHSLLLADIANQESQTSRITHLVIDEAHHLEEEAGKQFGWELSRDRMIQQLRRLSRNGAALAEARGQALKTQENYWQAMDRLLPPPKSGQDPATLTLDRQATSTKRWAEAQRAHQAGFAAGKRLKAALSAEISQAEADGNTRRAAALMTAQEFLSEALDRLQAVMTAPDRSRIRWLERSKQGGAVIKDIPLDVAPVLQKRLFAKKKSVILTLATLTAAPEDFRMIRSRTGFPASGRELSLRSPFDYPNQAQILIPKDLPAPRGAEHADAVAQCLTTVAQELHGRTLALFTSHAALNGCAKQLRDPLESRGIRVLAQGRDGTPAAILDSFRQNPQAVILGTASFWEGVDLSGEELRAVAICRLPFPVPADPVIAARSETFRNPFRDYQLPLAILKFRQGFGRLIRSRRSKGSVIILGPCIRNASYGSRFIQSLPQCKYTPAVISNSGRKAAEWLETG